MCVSLPLLLSIGDLTGHKKLKVIDRHMPGGLEIENSRTDDSAFINLIALI